MGFMTSLRDKTHVILFTLLIAFLALIIFEWGMQYTGGFFGKGNTNLAGKVNGKEIPYSQYDEIYKEISENFRRSNPSTDITPEIELGMQEQAWKVVVDQTLLEQQLGKFGITLQDQEVVEALDGPNPPMVIRQNFTDPATGTIDRKKLDAARRDPRAKDLWVQVEKIVRRELKISKLIRALQSLDHLNGSDIDDIVKRQLSRFSASFIPFPFSFAVPDSNFPVKEDEIKKYYDEHKELFKQVPSRKADYVFFPLIPSSKDSLSSRTELEALRAEFSGAKSDSEFVKLQSDRSNGINVQYNRSNFSESAASVVFNPSNLKPGALIGPVADRGEYRLIKVREVTTSAQPVARASHILLKVNPANSNDVQRVRELIPLIFKQLQAGVPFEELARKYSTDPGSAANGGDIGWFSKDKMVPAFSEAVFKASPGAVIGPVQTQFGLHIIKVTGFDQKAIVCSEIVRNIKPSTETADSRRRIAMAFQMTAKTAGLDKAAASQKLQIEKTGEFGKRMPIQSIGYSDKISSFAFKSKESEVSDVIETEKGFYIMRLTARNDTGYRLLDQELKERITAELVREKNGSVLEKKLVSMAKSPGATLENIAAANPGINVVTAEDIRWSDAFIPGYGIDRPLVEAMSGLDNGKLSAPVKTASGYALAIVTRKALPEGVDLKAEAVKIAPQLLQVKQQQTMEEYFNSVRKNSKIEDLRP